MSVDAFRLQNFMAFKDSGWIELRRLSLLLGRNSSGKTAAIRALRLMKQSLQNKNSSQALTFKFDGGVDVGSFKNIIHNPGASGRVAGAETNPDDTAGVVFSFRGALTSDSVSNAIEWSLIKMTLGRLVSEGENALMYEVCLTYTLDTTAGLVALSQVRASFLPAKNQTEFIHALDFQAASTAAHRDSRFGAVSFDSGLARQIFRITSLKTFLPDLEVTDALDDHSPRDQEQAEGLRLFWLACQTEIKRFLKSIQYIGPIRPEPKRYYSITDAMYEDWQRGGWGFLLDFLLDRQSETRIEKVNYWLGRMNLGGVLVAEKLVKARVGDLRDVVELTLYEGESRDKSLKRNILEIGYGASQIVPIILLLTAEDQEFENALIVVEQPELHLHPQAQAEIADLLIDTAERTSLCVLVETHSEHLLLRTQRRIAETTLDRALSKNGLVSKSRFAVSHSSVGLIFVTRRDGKSAVEVIEPRANGELNRPSVEFQDFFKYDYDDVVKLNEAIAGIVRLQARSAGNDDRDGGL